MRGLGDRWWSWAAWGTAFAMAVAGILGFVAPDRQRLDLGDKVASVGSLLLAHDQGLRYLSPMMAFQRIRTRVI